nr:hypothetical protein GCM10020063_085410 [Dactylosporangium thailandense]
MHIAIPAFPGLMVVLKPVLKITVGGQVSLDFQWAPRMAVGFVRSPNINTDVHAFGSSSSVTLSSTVGADVFLGLSVELSLAGRLGVEGAVGPDLGVEYDASTQCVSVFGQTKAELSANASVFVKNWSFAIASGVFGRTDLYQHCFGGGGGGDQRDLTLSAGGGPAGSWFLVRHSGNCPAPASDVMSAIAFTFVDSRGNRFAPSGPYALAADGSWSNNQVWGLPYDGPAYPGKPAGGDPAPGAEGSRPNASG